MCQSDTHSGPGAWLESVGRKAILVVCAALTITPAWSQIPPGVQPDWRHIGSTAVELALASPASGPADRVWFSPDSGSLFVRTSAGQVFETTDFEKWRPSAAKPPSPDAPGAAKAFPGGGNVRVSPTDSLRLYAYGGHVFRSDDGGLSWANVTASGRRSIIGGEVRDLAVSPRDAEDLVAANDAGVWRSLDGGISWAGLNESLPNLPARRIAALPRGAGGLRLQAGGFGTIEWAPGEKRVWRPVSDAASTEEEGDRRSISNTLGAQITALAASGDFLYAGSAGGRIWVSGDKGRSWTAGAAAGRGPVEAIWTDQRDPRLALAALGRNPHGTGGARVLRTLNAGQFWDDLSADLPDASAHGIAADRASGAVYVATDRGLFQTRADLNAAGPVTPWTAIPGLPAAPILDVKLDPEGNQLFAAVDGYGVYAAMAPHRLGNLRLVNAADFSPRAAAPGSLVSVLGGRVLTARAGELNIPVLAASETETQIQVPFSARGSSLALALDTGRGSYRVALPLEGVSPAIFVDRDGTPLITNADTGVLLDAMNTAHSNARVQILMTGLGGVRPEWPTGVPGPFNDPPQVIAPVRVFVDRVPVEVTRAILAPGYIGLYLVEIQMPALVNSGPAEVYVESDGRESNRARLWIEP